MILVFIIKKKFDLTLNPSPKERDFETRSNLKFQRLNNDGVFVTRNIIVVVTAFECLSYEHCR